MVARANQPDVGSKGFVARVERDGEVERRVMAVVHGRIGPPQLIVAEHGEGIARRDAGLELAPQLDGDVQRPLELDGHASGDALVEIVVA